MSENHTVLHEKAQDFFEKNPACQSVMSYLDQTAEIAISVGQSIECRYFKQKGLPKLILGRSEKPDLILNFSPEGFDTLTKANDQKIDDLIVNIFKLYLAGLIKIELSKSTPQALLKSYIKVLQLSHEKLLPLLKSYGASSLSLIPLIMQKLKITR